MARKVRVGRELAELVPDHGLGDEHRDVLAAVVHRDGVAQHGRDDHRAARPGLDHVLGALSFCDVHLLEQVVVDEGALLQTAWHLRVLLALLVRLAPTDDELVAGLAGWRVRPSFWPHGVTGWRPPEVLPSPPPCGWSTGFMATPRTVGRMPFQRMRPALPQLMLRLLGVADLADGGAAAHVDVADLAGRHAQLRVRAVLGDQLHAGAGRAGDLGAAARPQLDRVDDRTDRDVAQRQVVARLDVGARAGLDGVALLEQLGRDDVALLAVDVVQQRDARGAVRVVLDVRDLGRHAVLVVAPEVDHAVGRLWPPPW